MIFSFGKVDGGDEGRRIWRKSGMRRRGVPAFPTEMRSRGANKIEYGARIEEIKD